MSGLAASTDIFFIFYGYFPIWRQKWTSWRKWRQNDVIMTSNWRHFWYFHFLHVLKSIYKIIIKIETFLVIFHWVDLGGQFCPPETTGIRSPWGPDPLGWGDQKYFFNCSYKLHEKSNKKRMYTYCGSPEIEQKPPGWANLPPPGGIGLKKGIWFSFLSVENLFHNFHARNIQLSMGRDLSQKHVPHFGTRYRNWP